MHKHVLAELLSVQSTKKSILSHQTCAAMKTSETDSEEWLGKDKNSPDTTSNKTCPTKYYVNFSGNFPKASVYNGFIL